MISGSDVPVNLTLIGNEMLGCSDAENRVPGGRALQHLLTALTRSATRVLLAGPHDDALVEAALAGGAEVTCLLRAYIDAFAVATAYPQVRVLAGSLAKLDPSHRYDVVIAGDGCWRLCSADGPQLDWQDCVDRLRGSLAPAGILALAVANPLGIDRLIEVPPIVSAPDDSAPAALADITALDMAHASVYCAYPTSTSPSVLISTSALDHPTAVTQRTLAAVVATACAQEFAGRAVLADPRRLATTTVRSGAVATLAASWIVVATSPGAELPAMPTTIVADRPGAPGFDARYELTAGPSTTRLPVPAPVYRRDALERDSARLAEPIPSGRFLDELLSAAAASGDGPAMRQALHGYATWLETLDDPIPATPANVVTDGESYAQFDPSWSWHRPVPPAVALVRALRNVAATLVAAGTHHPWPATTDVDELTMTIAAAAGRPTDRATVAAAVELDAAVRLALGGDRSAVQGPVEVTGHRELTMALRQEREETEHLRALVAWYGYLLDDRERTLAQSERMVELFSRSLRYRAYRVGAALGRRARRAVRPRLNSAG